MFDHAQRIGVFFRPICLGAMLMECEQRELVVSTSVKKKYNLHTDGGEESMHIPVYYLYCEYIYIYI